MVLFYNSIQCGRTSEYLLGPNSTSSVVMLSQCCYMDLRDMERNENHHLKTANFRQLLLTMNPEHALAGSDFK
jgi:hypothetical protein